MNEVLGRILVPMLDGLGESGVDIAAARACLKASDDQLRGPTFRVPWDDYVACMEALERSCGGPDGMRQAFHEAQPKIFAAHFPALRHVLAPRDLFRLLVVMMNFIYLAPRFTDTELPDGRLRIMIEVPEPYRPTTAIFQACAGGMPSTTGVIGLPDCEVESDISPRLGIFTIRLPESRTLGARLRRAASGLLIHSALREVEHTWTETRSRLAELESANANLADLTRRLEEEMQHRERVEAALRAALDIGRDAPAPGAPGGAGAGVRDFERRLEKLAEAWKLTPRQVEVVALVARGLPNKEIAYRLECALHTVELHVSEVLRKSRAASRSALTAALWADPESR